MAIITDGKNFNVSLTNKNYDWFSLLQFCICKVNPRYYKNIRIKKERVWWLHWSGLNNNPYCYPFPEKTKDKTIKKLEKNLPNYIKVIWD